MPPHSLRATVLIAAVGDTSSLRRVLEVVHAQAVAQDAEVLVVFNVPREQISETSRVALEQRCDRIVYEPRAGKSAALNHGIQLARGEVIAFTDDDTLPQPQWLARICERLLHPDRDPALVGVGGRVLPIFEAGIPGWFERLVNSRDTHYIGPRHDLGSEVLDYPVGRSELGGVCIGANFAMRREVFDTHRFSLQLGPNSRTGLRGGEDTAFVHKVLREKMRIEYVPEIVVHHPIRAERASLEFVRDACYAHGRESIRARQDLGLPLPTRRELLRKILKHTPRRPFRGRSRTRPPSGTDITLTGPETAARRDPIDDTRFERLIDGLKRAEILGRLAERLLPFARLRLRVRSAPRWNPFGSAENERRPAGPGVAAKHDFQKNGAVRCEMHRTAPECDPARTPGA